MLRRCLLVSCVLLIATGAHAETLDITGGSITSDGLLNDTLFGFGGPTFNVQGVNFDKTYLGGPTFFIGFSPQPSMPAGQVVFDGFPPCTLQTSIPASGCGGFLNLTIAPLFPPGGNMFDPNYLATAPFTATGQILLSPVASTDCTTVSFPPDAPSCTAFDLVGQGLVTVRGSVQTFPGPVLADASFVFSTPTPEPSTLVLLSIGILTLRLLRLLPNSKIQRVRIIPCALPPASTSDS